MNRPNFETIFTEKSDYCEKTSTKPVSTFVPGQSISLKELVTRFERGQRLNVHCNFAPGSNLENITDDEALARVRSEGLNGEIDKDDFPPTDVYDIVDVEHAMCEHENHKRDYVQRMKKKKEEAKQAKQQKQAPQAPDDLSPDSPVA